MKDMANDALTEEVLSRFDESESERFKEITQSLVRHLHSFIREVGLTEAEWEKGIEFLTRTGHITDDKRQEFILLSDVLGASMQVIDINHQKPEEATESTVFGPFFVEGSPRYENGDDLSNGAKGEPCYMHGRVLDTSGKPIAGAHIEVWQSDEDGFYDVQYEELDRPQNRGKLEADEEGNYYFWAVKPVAYPIPNDGPVGNLLAAAGRSPMRPAHVHFMVQAPGYETLITHVFEEGDEYLDSDAVFGVKNSLITRFKRHDTGSAPDGTTLGGPFYTMNYDLVLASEGEKADEATGGAAEERGRSTGV